MKWGKNHGAALFVAAFLVLLGAASLRGQQPPEAAQKKVLIAGENPILRLLDKPGGKAVAEIAFWRAHWSPVGNGNVCFVTTRDSEGQIKLRIALNDNPKLVDYASKELMPNLAPQFAMPPFTPVKASCSSAGDGLSERREICKSDRYTVEAVWRKLGEGRFIEEKRPTGLELSFFFIPAAEGEVLINGEKAQGSVFPGGPFGGAFLSFNETWKK